MTSTFSPFDLRKVFDFAPLKSDVARHLRNIYAMLAVGIIATAIGCVIDIYVYQIGGWVTMILAGLAFSYAATPQHQLRTKDTLYSSKALAFVAFAVLKGISFGQLFRSATFLNPSILPTALFGTLAVFICFSLAAVLASRRDMLFISAAASSMLLFATLTSIATLFSRSPLLISVNLYVGLLTFICYVIFDTQLIITRFNSGDRDVVAGAAQLYYDLFAVFVRLVILLTNKEKRKRRD